MIIRIGWFERLYQFASIEILFDFTVKECEWLDIFDVTITVQNVTKCQERENRAMTWIVEIDVKGNNFTTIHRFISISCHYYKTKPLSISVWCNKYNDIASYFLQFLSYTNAIILECKKQTCLIGYLMQTCWIAHRQLLLKKGIIFCF
jgi:hypothetical protein